MAKLTLSDISNLSGNPSAAENTINSNSAAIETALENTLSRDGTSPNQMNANLDMNSKRILNLPAPVNGTEPLRLQDASTFIEVTGTLLPSQSGHAGEYLGTDGTNISWSSPEVSSAVITELLRHIVPKGTVVMWSGSVASIPTGWSLCDGSNVVGFGITPDLRNRFVLGAGSTYSPTDTGGFSSVSTSAGGGHTPVIQGHALTAAENGPHTHRPYVWNTNSADGTLDGFARPTDVSIAGEIEPGGAYITANTSGTQIIESSGSGTAHSHGADAVPDHTHTVSTMPPYYALAYIVKVIDYVAP